MKIRVFAPVVFSIVAAMNCYADNGSVVFGSWQILANAERGFHKVHDTFGVDPRISPSVVNGASYYRVVSQVLPEAEARALIADAVSRGYQAWYLRSPARPNPAPFNPSPIIPRPRPVNPKVPKSDELQSAVVQPVTCPRFHVHRVKVR